MRLIFVLLIVVIVVAAFAAIVYGVGWQQPAVSQPIAFNHSLHINDAGLTCLECHKNAETRIHAGLPGKSVCFDCHDIDEEQGSHPEKDRLFAYDETDEDIPWVRVAVVPPNVFFSHRRHVSAGGLDCLECHPAQPTLTAPPSRVRMVMPMTACIQCHDQTSTSTDCLACHR